MNMPLTPAALADMTNDELLAAYKQSMAFVEAAIAANPDVELIRVCDGHAALMDAAFNPDAVDTNDDSPVWIAYSRSCKAISEAAPRTRGSSSSGTESSIQPVIKTRVA